MSSITTTTEIDGLKAGLKETWMAGDYDRFSRYMEQGARIFYEQLDVPAGCQLLDVADDLECACGCIRGRNVVIRGERAFQSLPRLKVTELTPGIQHPSDSHQMALLTNAVAGARFKLCRIHNRAGSRVCKMLSGGAVAPLTRDAFSRENGRAILVIGAGNVKSRSCVAEDATLGDRTCEVGILRLLIAGGQIIRIATLVKGDRRLEEMPRDVDQIAACVVARADYVIDVVVADVSFSLQTLPGAGRRGVHRNLAAGSGDCAGWFLPGPAQGVGHRRMGIPFDFGEMADLAATRTHRLASQGCGRSLRIRVSRTADLGVYLSWRNKAEQDEQHHG